MRSYRAAKEALGSATLDLRRLAWDLSLFTTSEFGFVSLPSEYTTGSSIMPNKRNPDVIEVKSNSYCHCHRVINAIYKVPKAHWCAG